MRSAMPFLFVALIAAIVIAWLLGGNDVSSLLGGMNDGGYW